MDSGIVVDIGFQQAEILPICRSRLCTEGLEVSYVGAIALESRVNKLLLQDNEKNERLIQ